MENDKVKKEVKKDVKKPESEKGKGGFSNFHGHKKNIRHRSRRSERPKSEFDQKIINIRRVTRVAAGGRRFSFSVAIILGDKKGRVGIGVGKGNDTALAIEKAANRAKKNIVKIKLTESGSISHSVKAKYSSAVVFMQPSVGKGLVAGSSVRDVLTFAGVNDVVAKIVSRSKNKLNNAQAALNALSQMKTVK